MYGRKLLSLLKWYCKVKVGGRTFTVPKLTLPNADPATETLCSVVPNIASKAILSVIKYLISNSGTVSSSTFAYPPIETLESTSGSRLSTLSPTSHFPALLKEVLS